MKEKLKTFFAWWGALLTVLLIIGAFVKKKPAQVSAQIAPKENAVPTLPLEIGEGDSRDGEATMTQGLGMYSLKLRYGTRVERLRDTGNGKRGEVRVRVVSGEHSDQEGWVPAYQVQAAR